MRVLIATAGLSHDEAALHLGAQIARRIREPLTILAVARQEADRSQADEALSHAHELLQTEDLDLQNRVRIGNPAVEIIREAEDGNYDLVIVGERQERNLLRRFVHGSTTVRIVEHAPCAVIVAKGQVRPFRRILLCDSGAQNTSLQHHPGPSLLSRFTAGLTGLLSGDKEMVVLHVMSQISAGPGVVGRQLRSNARELIDERTPEGELLQEDLDALEKLGVHARAEVRHGLVVDEIQAEAQSGDYDLVVIGAYRGEGWQRILLDDQAHRILIQLDRPVLIVR
jgi:nucleotide-binding universal stress UspA family protein